MVRWCLLLLVLLSLCLIGTGLVDRAGKMYPKSVWGLDVPAETDPLTYVSFSSKTLDATAALFSGEALQDPADAPVRLGDNAPIDAPAGSYVYLRIEELEAYAQIPLAAYQLPPYPARLGMDELQGVWIPPNQHGFQPIDPQTKQPLAGKYALLVTGSQDVTKLLNWQWRQERSWTYFVVGSSVLSAVSLVLLGGVLFGWKVRPAVPDVLKPYAAHLVRESPPWWVISRSIGVVCILAGLIGMLSAIVAGDALEREFFEPIVWVAAFLGAPIGWILVGLGAQIWQRNIAAAMRGPLTFMLRRKERPPILYLRSFAEDARWLEQPIDLLWMFLVPGRFETSERSLTRSLAGAGPLIAIGQPGEMLPPMGAARLYVKHDKWQEVVAHLAKISGLIVLRVGTTNSFWWEVAHVIESCPPEKIIFMVPSSNRFRMYDALARFLAPRLKQLFPQPRGDMQFIGFRKDWMPVLLSTAQITRMSRFRQLLTGSAAPVLRDTLLPALHHAGYRVGRLPLQWKEWLLVLIAGSALLGIFGLAMWLSNLRH